MLGSPWPPNESRIYPINYATQTASYNAGIAFIFFRVAYQCSVLRGRKSGTDGCVKVLSEQFIGDIKKVDKYTNTNKLRKGVKSKAAGF